MEEQQLDEFFSVPVGLELVDNLYGFKVFSSDRLVNAFLKAIKSSSLGNPVYKEIEALVKSKKIMPVYQVKGIFKFLKHKMFGNPEDKAILGFYHMGIKRVYIMIDNNISAFGLANNNEIASTVIHECQHLFADMNRKKFMSIFKEELFRYYSSAFARIFKLRTNPKELQKIIDFIGTFEGEGLSNVRKKLNAYYKHLMLMSKYSELSNTEFKEKVEQTLYIINVFVNNFDTFVRNYREYIQILGPLNRAYIDAFGKPNLHTTSYQELISLSEVICVLSEIRVGYPKIKKVFKSFT
jgi:hypothetical protein